MPKVLKKKIKKGKHTYASIKNEALKNQIDESKNLLINLLDAELFELAKNLINIKPELLNKSDGTFYPLESVIDNVDMFQYLHIKGANINQILLCNSDCTYLHRAIGKGSIPVVSYILENCDPNLLDKRDKLLNHDALQRAEMFNNPEIIRMIKRYQLYEEYDEEDESILDIDLDNVKECRKVLKLFLRNDDKRNCYLKTKYSDMSRSDQIKCFSILKDCLNYWAF